MYAQVIQIDNILTFNNECLFYKNNLYKIKNREKRPLVNSHNLYYTLTFLSFSLYF